MLFRSEIWHIETAEFGADTIDRQMDRLSYFRTKVTTGVVTISRYADEKHFLRTDTKHIGCEQRFRQRRRVWIHADGNSMSQDILLTIERDRSCRTIIFDGVDQNQSVEPDEVVDEIQRWGADVENLHGRPEFVASFQRTNRVRPNSVVTQQDIADTDDGNVFHRTFTFAI